MVARRQVANGHRRRPAGLAIDGHAGARRVAANVETARHGHVLQLDVLRGLHAGRMASGITRGSDLPLCTSSTCAPDGSEMVSGVTPCSSPSIETRAATGRDCTTSSPSPARGAPGSRVHNHDDRHRLHDGQGRSSASTSLLLAGDTVARSETHVPRRDAFGRCSGRLRPGVQPVLISGGDLDRRRHRHGMRARSMVGADGRHPRVEALGRGDIVAVARKHGLEGDLRFVRRLERGARVELQSAREPRCQRLRYRRDAAIASLAGGSHE